MVFRLMLLAYAALTLITLVVLAWLRGNRLWLHPDPWLVLPGGVREPVSAFGGVVLALAVVGSTQALVSRTRWAAALARELMPFAASVSSAGIVVLALASALGEELFFRALLSPLHGSTSLVLSSVAFGLVHQVRGEARWGWVVWATIIGAALGVLFAASGSLVGPVIAHALVNGVNLSTLRERALEGR